ncbi:eukaryotic translation initiation factor 3 subunit H-B isoform X4 [Myxocyprinus asiaticus]|uniref:eukaryotic translation initiation factor 3 subunit H-B isoform X4 n=1 Tax=Myxocyprinus asiaticus TaxID=70543 RepID=UPI002223AEC2|nr:eukaryotic translation initiation factor 3 subunit H-B isoform X4 [Myxocyprinus asiaticus]
MICLCPHTGTYLRKIMRGKVYLRSRGFQVVLKIIKHYQEEGQGTEVVQGVLLGLVVEDRLEITNCFPFPQHTEDDADFDEDPIKTSQGSLCLKAYRLTPKLMEICKEKDFSADGLKKANAGYENMFEEVPIIIKNSHLINVLLWELEEKSTVADKHELLNLSSSSHLEKSLQMLMDRVDDMSQDIVKYNNYCRSLSKQQQQKHQYIQRRQQENAQRQSHGEPPLPEEDLSKMFKPPQPPPRMDTLLIASQINTYCQTIKEFTSQNLGKLFMAEALQGHSSYTSAN